MLNLADFGGTSNTSSEARSVTIGGGKGIQDKTTIIMTDFVWNEELDPALFSLEPPEDIRCRKNSLMSQNPVKMDL